ncbi:MAG: hypothetical protein LQ343_002830 [Gyalolechia ehrenbergii]|nr:MAG: hypothetical protein LQ343_002830 [Gyalolechia ehrenbergii]
MGREEQIEEREVLDSIFPDEITATFLLTITYPPSYPDEPPLLDLSLPPNAPKPPHIDISADRPHLLSSLTTTISENIGIAMIYTLVTTMQENIETLIHERIAVVQKAKDKETEEAEAKENAKFHGEKVTRESFLRWREKFREEMDMREEEERLRREAEMKGKGGKKEEKLTGRELWERGMVGKVEEEDAELEDAVEGLKVV